MPLLDVVFLLLTFFIYAMVVMVRADALSVGLAPVSGDGGPEAAPEHVLTINAAGGFTYNGDVLDPAALDPLLNDLATDPLQPTLYVALETGGDTDTASAGFTDRGPLIWSLLQRFDEAGLERVSIIGPPDG